jgi:DNA-binding CsgD family transcriptional regulator
MPLFDLLAGTLDGAFAVSRHQQIVFWNNAAQQILGFEPDAVLGRRCHEVLGGTGEGGCTVCRKGCATFSASLQGELSPTRDAQVHTSCGGRRWINVTTFVVSSRSPELALLAHVFRDAGQTTDATRPLEQMHGGAVVRAELHSVTGPLVPLTGMERKVLRLLASGATTDTMCLRLGVHATTVRTHVQHIMEKLGVHTRLEAVVRGAQNGWLGLPDD